jgi:hypothetical protein
MKYLIPLLLIFNGAFCQHADLFTSDSNKITGSEPVQLNINEKPAKIDSANRKKIPVSAFIVKDVRYDTGYAGFVVTKKIGPKAGFQKLELINSTSAAIADYLNNSARFSFDTTNLPLVCYIKKFRFSQNDTFAKSTNKIEIYSRMLIELEAYLIKGNELIPAIRLDTSMIAISSRGDRFALLYDALNAFAAKVGFMDLQKVLARTHYTFGTIGERYAQRFAKPILAADKPTNGVYKNAMEFINNDPSLPEYKVEQRNGENILYTRTGTGNWVPDLNAFGVYDGNRFWINFKNTFRPLVKVGNTFEFVSEMKDVHGKTAPPVILFYRPDIPLGVSAGLGVASALLILATRNDRFYAGKIVYQLDMETGEVY